MPDATFSEFDFAESVPDDCQRFVHLRLCDGQGGRQGEDVAHRQFEIQPFAQWPM